MSYSRGFGSTGKLVILTLCLALVGSQRKSFDEYRAVTVTHYAHTNSISVKLTYNVCAVMISATEPCVRKRSAPIEPIIVAYDDQLHDELHANFFPAKQTKRKMPSNLLRSLNLRRKYNWLGFRPTPVNIESSIEPREPEPGVLQDTLGQFLINRLPFRVRNAFGLRDTFSDTVTVTSTRTSVTTIIVPTSTKTFILESCLPPGFNFPSCRT